MRALAGTAPRYAIPPDLRIPARLAFTATQATFLAAPLDENGVRDAATIAPPRCLLLLQLSTAYHPCGRRQVPGLT